MEGHSLGGSSPGLLSAEEIRRRRLAALNTTNEQSSLSSPPPQEANVLRENKNEEEEEEVELQAAIALSLGRQDESSPQDSRTLQQQVLETTLQDDDPSTYLLSDWYQSGEPFDVALFHQIMWDSALTTENDKSRWLSQGIHVREEEASSNTTNINTTIGNTMLDQIANSHLPWGLIQQHGGPCGVLAAVQAEMLRLLLFANNTDFPEQPQEMRPAEPIASQLIQETIARSIALILARAALTPPAYEEESNQEQPKSVKLVLPVENTNAGLSWGDLEPWSSAPDVTTRSNTLLVYTITPPEPPASGPKRQKTATSNTHESLESRIIRLARAVSSFLLSSNHDRRPLESFGQDGGVLLMVMSLVASRGKQVIQKEFDDPVGTKLTSQFGHCGQELMNLLLTGQAVSNVFDNTLTPSGEMVCRGIQSESEIGYLSQLEAMRYCEVGGYYKSPRFPIWVVGSTSHFTVLFGDAEALKESQSDVLLEKCRRAFKAVEGGEENGFIAANKLGDVLKSLDLDIPDTGVQTLAASLEVTGADIILWDDFWKATSRLMTGASLESVLQENDDEVQVLDEPPPLIPAGAIEQDDQKVAPSPMETDEEMARRLAAEWNTHSGMSALTEAAARAASPMEAEPTAMSDEELARKLQAEWDAELSGTASSVAAVNGSPTPGNDDGATFPSPPRTEPEEDSKPTAQVAAEPSQNLEFEKYGDSFALYHYNGLRPGVLTPIRVTRLSAVEAVGASIALNRGNSASSHSSSGAGDLEDVIRTKWPSCQINWLGKAPPSID